MFSAKITHPQLFLYQLGRFSFPIGRKNLWKLLCVCWKTLANFINFWNSTNVSPGSFYGILRKESWLIWDEPSSHWFTPIANLGSSLLIFPTCCGLRLMSVRVLVISCLHRETTSYCQNVLQKYLKSDVSLIDAIYMIFKLTHTFCASPMTEWFLNGEIINFFFGHRAI